MIVKAQIIIDGETYEGELKKASSEFLARVLEYDEVFLVSIKENIKQWVMNPQTFEKRFGTDWKIIKPISLDELKKYPVGESLNDFGESENPPDIYYPDETNAWRPNSKGIFTLKSGIPTVEEFGYMGLDLVIPYKTLEPQLVNISRAGGEIIFMQTARDEAKYSIAGYCVEDEPENRPDSRPLSLLWDWYNKIRDESTKPVGCVFMAITMDPNCADYVKYKEFIDAMDFLILTYYPWDDRNSDNSDSAVMGRLEKIAGWVKNCGKPVMIAGQATYGSEHLLQPKIKFQSDYWRGKGYGIVWYVWNGQGTGIQAEFIEEIKNNG